MEAQKNLNELFGDRKPVKGKATLDASKPYVEKNTKIESTEKSKIKSDEPIAKHTVATITNPKLKNVVKKQVIEEEPYVDGVLPKEQNIKFLSSERINITPDKSLIPKMGVSGISFYQAIAEFIDNSIDAASDQQLKDGELKIDLKISVAKQMISVMDNAVGMNKLDISNSAKLAVSNKLPEKIGKFGFGLKTAMAALCDNYIVRSGVKGSEVGYLYEFDGVKFSKYEDWYLELKKYPKSINQHGTELLAKNTTILSIDSPKVSLLKKDISKRYRSYISKHGVSITVNNKKIEADVYEWAEGYPLPVDVDTPYGKVTGWIGLMKTSSQKSLYGFDIYKNGRMIRTNDKFAIGSHATLARIMGELNIDFLQVNNNKTSFLEHTKEYEEVQALCSESPNFIKVKNAARLKKTDDESVKSRKAVEDSIIENSQFINWAIHNVVDKDKQNFQTQGFKFTNTSKKSHLGSNAQIKLAIELQKPTTNKKRGRHALYLKRVTNPVNYRVITTSLGTIKWQEFFYCDKNQGRKYWDYNKKNQTLEIYINEDFCDYISAKSSIKELEKHVLNIIIDSISEYMVNSSKADDTLSNYLKLKDDFTTGIQLAKLQYEEEMDRYLQNLNANSESNVQEVESDDNAGSIEIY